MPIYTTEIASEVIVSDNPIHQRLLKPYFECVEFVHGDVLEVGCGEGRGVQLLAPEATSFTGLDKIETVIEKLKNRYPLYQFHQAVVPPFEGLEDDAFDMLVSFQVIEHIQDDYFFLDEIYRVLKPGGKAYLTTPNRKMTLTRNPWHIREYTALELDQLARQIFDTTEMKGITGNEKVMQYYEQNKASVEKITRWDIFDLQYKLPASWLRIPYEILNRLNRNKLRTGDNSLVTGITHEDYLVSENADESLDLFCILTK